MIQETLVAALVDDVTGPTTASADLPAATVLSTRLAAVHNALRGTLVLTREQHATALAQVHAAHRDTVAQLGASLAAAESAAAQLTSELASMTTARDQLQRFVCLGWSHANKVGWQVSHRA